MKYDNKVGFLYLPLSEEKVEASELLTGNALFECDQFVEPVKPVI